MIALRLLLLLALLILPATAVRAATAPGCVRASGQAGVRCLDAYLDAVERCRVSADVACELAVRAPGGLLETVVAPLETVSRDACTEDTAVALGYVALDDVALRLRDACRDFGEDLLVTTYGQDQRALSGDTRQCQSVVASDVRRLESAVVRATAGCTLAEYAGRRCSRHARDTRIRAAAAGAGRRILRRCGAAFDALGLAQGKDEKARVADLVVRVVTRARHFAGRVYPPNDLGPTAEFGPFPVGVRTLTIEDPSRLNVQGTGPRPLTVELYYPSTAAAIAGVPKDIVRVLNVDIVATPAYRDVAHADGPFPLVIFSHGNGGIRFQSFFFAAHLASHGYVVATPDHHGNTFVDALRGIVDSASAVNRPRDMSFLLDELLAFNGEPGNFLAGAIDPERVGLSGHSFGGYTTFALAGGSSTFGTFTDRRFKAIFPQAPAAIFDDAFFSTITVPTLIVGGSIDTTTPFDSQQQRPFDHLPTGAAVVGLAEVTDAGHFTFSDYCEVPRALLAFLNGFSEACEPRHIPWRAAHDLVNYLSLNFFDATLSKDPKALARLSARRLNRLDDLVYRSK